MTLITNMIIYVVYSLLLVFVNVPLLCVILLRRRNRSRRELLFVAGMAIGDVIYALGILFSSTRRLEFYGVTAQDEFNVMRRECVTALAPLLLFFGNSLIGMTNLLNAVDRWLATHFPVWYFHTTHRYTLVALGVCYSICLAILLVNVFMVLTTPFGDMPVSVMCSMADSSYPGARDALTYFRWSCVVLSAFLYVLVAIGIRRRMKRHDIPTISKHNSKKLMKSNITMGLTLLNAVVFLLVPDILLQFNILGTSTVMRMFLYGLILTKTMVNFLIFVTRHKELRGLIVGTATTSSHNS